MLQVAAASATNSHAAYQMFRRKDYRNMHADVQVSSYEYNIISSDAIRPYSVVDNHIKATSAKCSQK